MFSFQNDQYHLANERELAEVLASFNSDYIFQVIDSYLLRRYEFAMTLKPNIVNAFKTNFDNIRLQYPMDIQNTNEIEELTYKNIIERISDKCGLEFNDDTSDNIYLLATTLYDFMVSRFTDYMISFLINLITRETDSIYSALNLEELKKNKDSSTIYNRKVMGDAKLAVIVANLFDVMKYLSELDIRFDDIISYTYHDTIAQLIINNFGETRNIYNEFMLAILGDSMLLPTYITEIKLKLQKI